MKSFVKLFFVALAIGALASVSAFAGSKDKVKKETVTFTSDVMVNGTLVKAGDYEVKFDETTGELTILKDGKVKAKTSARLEERTDKAKNTAVRTMDKGSNVAELVGITFGGSNQNVVVGSSGGAVTGNN
jgi:hypothetical protein